MTNSDLAPGRSFVCFNSFLEQADQPPDKRNVVIVAEHGRELVGRRARDQSTRSAALWAAEQVNLFLQLDRFGGSALGSWLVARRCNWSPVGGLPTPFDGSRMVERPT